MSHQHGCNKRKQKANSILLKNKPCAFNIYDYILSYYCLAALSIIWPNCLYHILLAAIFVCFHTMLLIIKQSLQWVQVFRPKISKFFSFYLELYKIKFKNLIRTGKLKFSFRGLKVFGLTTGSLEDGRVISICSISPNFKAEFTLISPSSRRPQLSD